MRRSETAATSGFQSKLLVPLGDLVRGFALSCEESFWLFLQVETKFAYDVIREGRASEWTVRHHRGSRAATLHVFIAAD
jgi:hypothetical protein